jgi:uncharacterized damage-inducible protein DinB
VYTEDEAPRSQRWIAPVAGYSPVIGRLVCMLTYVRERTLAAVEGLTAAALDHRHDAESNSIGALLAHVAASERVFQILTFENREPTAAEHVEWHAVLNGATSGRGECRDRAAPDYVEQLSALRQVTLAALGERDDAWLERALPSAPELNAHWSWFHVAEDEISHCGQIRWLKARLPRTVAPQE